MSYLMNNNAYLATMIKTDNEKDKAEASSKKTTTDTSAAKGIPFALLAAGAVLAESAKIVAEDTAKAYLLERLPTKSGALKTTLEKSLEAKEILDKINEENAIRAARVNRRILKLRDWVDSW